MNCKLVLSQRSQIFHNRRFFSSHAKLRSTIQRLGNNLSLSLMRIRCSSAGKLPVIVKLLVACECIQAARLRLFSAEAISTGFLSGFRCTTSIRDQFRRGPAQRWGARARAAS